MQNIRNNGDIFVITKAMPDICPDLLLLNTLFFLHGATECCIGVTEFDTAPNASEVHSALCGMGKLVRGNLSGCKMT